MARPVHGLLLPLPLLLVVCLLLLQVSECSGPSPSPSPSAAPADHLDDDALHHQLLLHAEAREARTARPPTSTEVARDGRRTGAAADDAAPSSAWATPARAVMGAIASSPPLQTSDRALLARAGMRRPAVLLLRSKLARRFLAGAGVDDASSATDGTAASCHSYNPHIKCPPAWKP